jgi:hypothetical protein
VHRETLADGVEREIAGVTTTARGAKLIAATGADFSHPVEVVERSMRAAPSRKVVFLQAVMAEEAI